MRISQYTITWENNGEQKMKIIERCQDLYSREAAEKYALELEPAFGRCIAIERKDYTI